MEIVQACVIMHKNLARLRLGGDLKDELDKSGHVQEFLDRVKARQMEVRTCRSWDKQLVTELTILICLEFNNLSSSIIQLGSEETEEDSLHSILLLYRKLTGSKDGRGVVRDRALLKSLSADAILRHCGFAGGLYQNICKN